MVIREYLRTLILGSSLLLPDKNRLTELFTYEITNNINFAVYILIIIIFNIILLVFIFKSQRFANLSLGYGFLLILCGLVLHKIKVIEFLTNNGIRLKEKSKINYLSHLVGFEKNKMSAFLTEEYSNPFKPKIYVDKPSINMKNLVDSKNDHESDTSSSQENSKKRSFKKIVKSFTKQPRFGIKQIKQPLKVKQFHQLQLNADTLPKLVTMNINQYNYSLIFLNDIRTILNQKLKNEKNLIIFYKNLEEQKKAIDILITDFSKKFDNFTKMSKLISAELFALNSSPKYFKFELNDLKLEVDKFFKIRQSIHKDNNLSILNYIDNILNLQKVNKDMQFVGNNDQIIKNVIKTRFLFLCIAIVCLFFICCTALNYYRCYQLLYITICMILVLLSFLSILFLLYAQILDKDCKSGRVVGCKMYLNSGSKYTAKLRQSELFKESETFKKNLEEFLKDTNENLKSLQNYIVNLSNENISYRVLIFKNLFDKILFVRDDFPEIVKSKIDTKKYFELIKDMYNILDQLLYKLNSKIKEEILEIFIKEIGYGYYINSDKQLLVDNVISLLSQKRNDEDLKLSAKCGSILDKLCMSKEYIENIFNLIVLSCVIILIFLI